MELDRGSFDYMLNDDGFNWCQSSAPFFGDGDDRGTPGGARWWSRGWA